MRAEKKSTHAFRRGKDHCMADLLFDWLGTVLCSFVENCLIQLWVDFQTSQRGGDTAPSSNERAVCVRVSSSALRWAFPELGFILLQLRYTWCIYYECGPTYSVTLKGGTFGCFCEINDRPGHIMVILIRTFNWHCFPFWVHFCDMLWCLTIQRSILTLTVRKANYISSFGPGSQRH